jgi:multisubunit Na+/H+ antiporter MnhG subunit
LSLDVIAYGLVAMAVMVSIVSVAGMLIAPTFITRLHYLGPITLIGNLCLATAVLVQESFNIRGLNAILIALTLFILQPLVSHATARGQRLRELGDWKGGS